MPVASLKERIAKKGYVLNGYCQMPGAFSAEFYSRCGWDCVTLDLQHGLIGEDMAIQMLQALTASGVMPLCRVGWLDAAIIMKVLDSGSLGVTCPMINTGAQAEQLVRYAKYPPRGERSMGPLRPSMIYGQDYLKTANDFINVFPMVETAEAVKNIEDIVAVDGINGIYIGSGDLAQSMGRPIGREAIDPEVDMAIEHVLQVCLKRDIIVGMMARNAEQAQQFIKRGFKFVGISSDYVAMTTQAKNWVGAVNKAMGHE